jgi:hypothetical protein
MWHMLVPAGCLCVRHLLEDREFRRIWRDIQAFRSLVHPVSSSSTRPSGRSRRIQVEVDVVVSIDIAARWHAEAEGQAAGVAEDIPTKPVGAATGNVTMDLGSAATEAGGAADVGVGNGMFALHAGGGGRRSGDVDTPEGEVVNSQSRNGFGTVGLSWPGTRGYFGGSYGYDDTKYGIPIVEGGAVENQRRLSDDYAT